jgi:hypothetical protein
MDEAIHENRRRSMKHVFANPETQQAILAAGSREEIIRWLEWNDPNGVWTDEDSAAEGWKRMTFDDARAAMSRAITMPARLVSEF